MACQRVGLESDKNWSFQGSNTSVPTISVFRPTWDEFKDFNAYLKHIEDLGAHKAGLAKIIPPPEWKPCQKMSSRESMKNISIKDPICQVVNGNRGIYHSINVSKRTMTAQEYESMAESERYRTPRFTDFEDLERRYWKNITFVSPIYGADVPGSVMDEGLQEWNIQHLRSCLDWVNEDYKIQISGVNTAYLYFGMWKSTFAWHTEDMDLHSINYLHHGSPKFWYSIPPAFARRFERMAQGYFSSMQKECPAYLRHKMCLISPSILRQNSIPYNKIVQEENEIMITFPLGYHSGFNTGYNLAESTNFATERWVEYGKRSMRCYCRRDAVNISMDTFVKRLQMDRYDKWLAGQDLGYHPEDDQKLCKPSFAPRPSLDDFLQNSSNSLIPDCMLTVNVREERERRRRHPIHNGKCGTTATTSDVINDQDDEDELTRYQRLSDFEKDQLKDIWFKAGEYDKLDVESSACEMNSTHHVRNTEDEALLKRKKKKSRTVKKLRQETTSDYSVDDSSSATETEDVSSSSSFSHSPSKVQAGQRKRLENGNGKSLHKRPLVVVNSKKCDSNHGHFNETIVKKKATNKMAPLKKASLKLYQQLRVGSSTNHTSTAELWSTDSVSTLQKVWKLPSIDIEKVSVEEGSPPTTSGSDAPKEVSTSGGGGGEGRLTSMISRLKDDLTSSSSNISRLIQRRKKREKVQSSVEVDNELDTPPSPASGIEEEEVNSRVNNDQLEAFSKNNSPSLLSSTQVQSKFESIPIFSIPSTLYVLTHGKVNLSSSGSGGLITPSRHSNHKWHPPLTIDPFVLNVVLSPSSSPPLPPKFSNNQGGHIFSKNENERNCMTSSDEFEEDDEYECINEDDWRLKVYVDLNISQMNIKIRGPQSFQKFYKLPFTVFMSSTKKGPSPSDHCPTQSPCLVNMHDWSLSACIYPHEMLHATIVDPWLVSYSICVPLS